ncbi:MAG TPA: FtsX-like permease family protein, partial [Gemmatimonadaceae bacterium]|nr:FtsX-like permease family protein [Gemmatimonadaceae bacterium]
VMSYLVTQRTREIGIRVALGASTGNVLRIIVRQGMMLAIGGIVIGVVGGLLLTRVLASLLYGVSATDPFTFAFVALVLAAVALLATYLPARRAAGIDPIIAMKAE